MLKEFIAIIFVLTFFLLVWFLLGSLVTYNKSKINSKKEISNYDELVGQFNSIFKIVRHQNTTEILECIIEMGELDKIYEKIKHSQINFIEKISYAELKKETLRKIINEKINKISLSTNAVEKFKSLKDELEYCKTRQPEFTEIFDAKLYSVEQNIKIYSDKNYK